MQNINQKYFSFAIPKIIFAIVVVSFRILLKIFSIMGTCVTRILRRNRSSSGSSNNAKIPSEAIIISHAAAAAGTSSCSHDLTLNTHDTHDNLNHCVEHGQQLLLLHQDTQHQKEEDVEWQQYSECLRSYGSISSASGAFDPYSMYYLHGSYVVDVEWSHDGDGSRSKSHPVMLLRLLPKWVQSALAASRGEGGDRGRRRRLEMMMSPSEEKKDTDSSIRSIAIVTLIIQFKKAVHHGKECCSAQEFDELMQECRHSYLLGIFFPAAELTAEAASRRRKHQHQGKGRRRLCRSHSSKVSVSSATMTFASFGRPLQHNGISSSSNSSSGSSSSEQHMHQQQQQHSFFVAPSMVQLDPRGGCPTTSTSTFLFSIVLHQAEFYTYNMTLKNNLAHGLISEYISGGDTPLVECAPQTNLSCGNI